MIAILDWCVRQQVITRANVNQDLCHRMASLGLNELIFLVIIILGFCKASYAVFGAHALKYDRYANEHTVTIIGKAPLYTHIPSELDAINTHMCNINDIISPEYNLL